MDNFNSSALLQSFQGIGSFQEMEASKYASAASVTVLLYNHILTLSDEVDLIWSSSSSGPKFLFLMSRYMIPPFLVVHAYGWYYLFLLLLIPLLFLATFPCIVLTDEGGFSGQILSDRFCKAYFATSLNFGMISIGINNFLVLLRLWSTWDYNRRLVYRTAMLFALSQIGTVITASLSSFIPEIAVLPYINSCALTKKIKFVQLWIPNLVFEAMVPVLVWLNVLSRPRKADSQITMELHRDGAIYIGTISIICITNAALSFNSPTSLTFLVMYMSWSLSNIVLSHLVLNCRKVSAVVAADIAHAQRRNWKHINEEAPTGMRFMDGDFELTGKEVWDGRDSVDLGPICQKS